MNQLSTLQISSSRDVETGITYRIANSSYDRLMAFRLIYKHYLQAGLISRNPFRFRVTDYQLLPGTQIFVAIRQGEPICTVSLIADGAAGLPMEEIYHEEVAQARNQGRFVGEVSSLAGCKEDFRSFLPLFVQLTRLMAQYARRIGMHQFLIAVHPKHAPFYERFMGFQQIGPARNYPAVKNAPAVACCLDFERIDQERPKCWHDFFGTPLPAADLQTSPLTDEEFKIYQTVADFDHIEAKKRHGTTRLSRACVTDSVSNEYSCRAQ